MPLNVVGSGIKSIYTELIVESSVSESVNPSNDSGLRPTSFSRHESFRPTSPSFTTGNIPFNLHSGVRLEKIFFEKIDNFLLE